MTADDAPGYQTVLGEAGACPEIEYAGTVWKVGHPVGAAKAALEEYVAASAVAEVEALRGVFPPGLYAKMEADTLAALRAKHHRTWGPMWLKAVEGPDGNVLFLYSLLKAHQPAATVDDARDLLAAKPLATLAALERVSPDFFTKLAAGLAVPLETRAEKAAEMRDRFLTGLRTVCGNSA